MAFDLGVIVCGFVFDNALKFVPGLTVDSPKVSLRVGMGKKGHPHAHRVGELAGGELGDDRVAGTKGKRVGTMPEKVYVVLNGGSTTTGWVGALSKGVKVAVVDGGQAGVIVDDALVVLVFDLVCREPQEVEVDVATVLEELPIFTDTFRSVVADELTNATAKELPRRVKDVNRNLVVLVKLEVLCHVCVVVRSIKEQQPNGPLGLVVMGPSVPLRCARLGSVDCRVEGGARKFVVGVHVVDV